MNNIRRNTPEELIPENASYYIKDGQQIRKGTIASAILNAEILESEVSTLKEKNDAIKILEELAAVLSAIGFNKHFTWKNPVIQTIFDNIKLKD